MPTENDLLGMPVRDFTAAVAAKTPTPGGGSAAGAVAALGTALAEMALNFTIGKPKYAEHAEFHAHLAGRLIKARRMFEALVAEDVAAYELYQAARKLPDGPDRTERLELATAAAIDVPRELTKLSLAVLGDLLELLPRSNRYLVTDLLSGAVLLADAVRMSDYNVRVNLPGVSDEQARREIRRSSADDLERAEAIVRDLERGARDHLP